MQFSEKILQWFDQHGRQNLPWQHNPTPYRVWISEIMLQQTQVSTVIPYFHRFIERFPDIQSLAQAPLDDVFQVWTGLGYYARAKNLHKSAHIIQTEHQGIFPTEFEAVLALPGIGPSTAGAILAISTQQRFSILDGNVKRVLCRYFGVEGFPGDPAVNQKLWDLTERVTPKNRVHHYTQAIMDLGATLCTRSKPNCPNCPVQKTCVAKKQNRTADYPTPRPQLEKPTKATQLLILIHPEHSMILFEKRPPKGIWGGLWSFPECPPKTKLNEWCQETFHFSIQHSEKWKPFRHTFTHFHLTIHPVVCHIKPGRKLLASQYNWHPLEKSLQLGLPAPVKRLLEMYASSMVHQ